MFAFEFAYNFFLLLFHLCWFFIFLLFFSFSFQLWVWVCFFSWTLWIFLYRDPNCLDSFGCCCSAGKSTHTFTKFRQQRCMKTFTPFTATIRVPSEKAVHTMLAVRVNSPKSLALFFLPCLVGFCILFPLLSSSASLFSLSHSPSSLYIVKHNVFGSFSFPRDR